ncbi:hypothetical protein [uncultured Shewanella sp.]|uniref:hypothetical protein n=1 Tax=uncultured Shewanella sp. TaxID=173975 RepID=UPI002621BE44|nr:hypothetical protein [uncultured Shewanella sp.]
MLFIAAAGFCANTKITRREYIPIGSDEGILASDGYFCIHTGFKSKEQRAKSKEQRAKSKEQRAKSKINRIITNGVSSNWVCWLTKVNNFVINIYDKDQVFSLCFRCN